VSKGKKKFNKNTLAKETTNYNLRNNIYIFALKKISIKKIKFWNLDGTYIF